VREWKEGEEVRLKCAFDKIVSSRKAGTHLEIFMA